jgi:hypothetical protein
MTKKTNKNSNDPSLAPYQGCQTVYFQTENPNLGKFGRVLRYKMLVQFLDMRSILRPFDIF